MSNCFKSVRILKSESTGKFFAKAVTCGSLACSHCREQIKAMLTTKILYAVNKHSLSHFFFHVSVNISSQNSSKLTPNGKCRACSLVLIKVFAEIKGERKRVHFGP
jgi:hypothetical protein